MGDLTLRLDPGSPHLIRQFDVRDLEFTKKARGGYSSATFTVPEWIDFDSAALRPLAKVLVDDAATARRVWEGYADIPGRTVADDGHSWKIGAAGTAQVLDDRSKQYIVVDRDLSGWQRATTLAGVVTGGRADVSSHPDDGDLECLVMQFPAGLPLANGSQVLMDYHRIDDAGQILGAFGFTADTGFTSGADNKVESVVAAPATEIHSVLFNTTPFTRGGRWNIEMSGTDYDVVALRIARESGGATNVTTDTYWGAFYDIFVGAKLYDKDGNGLSAARIVTDGNPLAHEVVVDALQWFTNMIDVSGATIDTSFDYLIDQMAYPDGTRMSAVLDDLCLFEPEAVYGVFESGANGKHRFEFRKIPTEVRYDADTRDGWDSPGGEAELANAVRVYWTNKRGRERSSVYTLTGEVPELDIWGRVREAADVHLGNQVGSQAAADRVGEAILEQIASIPFAGTLTVARPIYDRFLGREVMPWEIEPGYLVNIRDTGGPPTLLTETTYRDRDGTATLTIGTPVYSTEELVNLLAGQRAGAKRMPRSNVPPIYKGPQ